MNALIQLGIQNLISLQKIEKKKPGKEIDFHKYRKSAFFVSWTIVIIRIASVYSNRDKILGIDFKGGEELVVSFDQEILPHRLIIRLQKTINLERFNMFTVLKSEPVKVLLGSFYKLKMVNPEWYLMP